MGWATRGLQCALWANASLVPLWLSEGTIQSFTGWVCWVEVEGGGEGGWGGGVAIVLCGPMLPWFLCGCLREPFSHSLVGMLC